MRAALADNASTAQLQLQLDVTRQLGMGATQLRHSVSLDAAQRAAVARAAAEWTPGGGGGGGGGGERAIAINVSGLFPKFGRFGTTSGVTQAAALAS